MTDWNDLLLAVRCCWEPPKAYQAPVGAARPSGPPVGAARPSGPPAPAAPMRSVDDFFQALCYAFHVHRAAILVSIRSRRLVLFLPFANENYTMPQWQMEELDLPRSGSEYAALKQSGTGSRQAERMIDDPARWWFNGHVVCNVMPGNVWGDYQMRDLYEMIEYTLTKFPIPDTDFLLNKRDCPLLLKVHQTPRTPYLPVLSPYTGPAALDISFPLADDWRIASCSTTPSPPEWSSRKDARAVFRGSSTGIGIDETTNVRLALALFSSTHRFFLDVSITSVNDRDQIQGRAIVHPRVEDIKRRLVEANVFGKYQSLQEQAANYKFAIYIRGHQAASRLANLFVHGFLVLYFAPKDEHYDVPGCKTWLDDVLVPYDGWKGWGCPEGAGGNGGAGAGAGAVVAGGEQETHTTHPTEPTQTETNTPSSTTTTTETCSSVSKLLSALGGKRKRPRQAQQHQQQHQQPLVLPQSIPIRVGVSSAGGKGRGATGSGSESAFSTPQPEPNHVMCKCETFEELVECVRFMQNHDDIARVIAAQGHERIGRNMITKDAISSRVRNAMVASVSIQDSSPWDETTHTLFGISNIEYASKGLRVKCKC